MEIGAADCTAAEVEEPAATGDPVDPDAEVASGVATLTAALLPESISRLSRRRSARISDAT